MRTVRWSYMVGVGLVVVTMSCSERQSVSEPPTPALSDASPAAQGAYRTFDDEFARISQEEIPGFAGYYLDKDTNAVVLLVDEQSAPLAAEFVRRESARLGMSGSRPLIIRPARYDFATLKKWRDQIGPLTGSETVLTDIDEVENRIFLGVVDKTAGEQLRTKVVDAGIPDSALRVEVVPRTELRTSLQDYKRPLEGGLQLMRNGSAGHCTLGFVAALSGSLSYFTTASHCTQTRYGADGSVQNQPTVSPLFSVGYEYLDPSLHLCWWNFPCRYSDVALIRKYLTTGLDQGHIARTTYVGSGGPGSLIIDNARPYFEVLWKWNQSGDAPVGTPVNKVGRSTGWTSGVVTRTCINFGNDHLGCQWVTNTWSAGGDSGSPIFWRLGLFTDYVALHGSLWGGPLYDSATTYYSTLNGIETDFNVSLSVCVPSGGC